jgi:hypothetical protein
MKKTSIIAAIAFLVMLTISGCFGNPFERGLPAEGGGEINREVSYSSEVYPILNAGCSSCHTAGGLAGSTRMVLTGDAGADHADLLPLVDVNDPAASLLLQKGTGEAPHGGAALLHEGTTDYNLIKAWILQGADNN